MRVPLNDAVVSHPSHDVNPVDYDITAIGDNKFEESNKMHSLL